ncbi:hypothetical protein SETIT_5G256400v2 [Setaria italica]|uniref:CBS domain-containing protein n=1 Tax=Setaria italica TaxID=4555 RepID=K3XPP2_SETIT|nr:hypothetical protein SETIT_5G256400v2 [Setaria italica]
MFTSCDVESVSATFTALSMGDVMMYIDCSLSHMPPEFLLRAVRAQLKDRGLDAIAELMDTAEAAFLPLSPSSSSTSFDDDSPSGWSFGWRSTEDAVACHSRSSLVAVMAQALAHHVGYVWVVNETSGALIGVVRFTDVLALLWEHLRPQSQVLCR